MKKWGGCIIKNANFDLSPRIYISAAHKSSGKTTLSIGLCAAFHKQGLTVQPFKKGPDYIDPLWLSLASGNRDCHNLDFNTMSNNEIIRDYQQYSLGADINLIEGNKGLYDGVALDGSDSNAAVAKLVKAPVILVIDSRGVTRGVAPLLLGYQQFDPDVNIAGVIYNLSSGGRHASKLKAITQEYTDIPVLGIVTKNKALEVDERHLGLKPSNEALGAQQKIDDIADIIADSVDLSALLDISKTAQSIQTDLPLKTNDIVTTARKVRIGICEDSAFSFYYASDKKALINAGAELITVNTLTDEGLPNNLDGLFIGGGFPETQMEQLESNVAMRKSIYDAIKSGMPTYAECGGLMYLSQKIYWKEKSSAMVGIIPTDIQMHQKPQGRGYVKLEETKEMSWEKDDNQPSMINAHEFHYSAITDASALLKKGSFAYKVHRGVGITGKYDGWVYKNLIANYSHMRDTDQYHWAKRFVEFIRKEKERQ